MQSVRLVHMAADAVTDDAQYRHRMTAPRARIRTARVMASQAASTLNVSSHNLL
jgi:hypothetical protein